MLSSLGLSRAERHLILGLQMRRSKLASVDVGLSLSDEQLSSRVIGRLAANPPPDVGGMQRRTRAWLLRPFPTG